MRSVHGFHRPVEKGKQVTLQLLGISQKNTQGGCPNGFRSKKWKSSSRKTKPDDIVFRSAGRSCKCCKHLISNEAKYVLQRRFKNQNIVLKSVLTRMATLLEGAINAVNAWFRMSSNTFFREDLRTWQHCSEKGADQDDNYTRRR